MIKSGESAFPVWLAVILGTWAILVGVGRAPTTLKVGSVHTSPSAQRVEVPVELRTTGNSNLVALQIVLEYDSQRLTFNEVTRGPVAEQAGKDVSANGATPGRVSIVIFGMNQNPIKDGTLALLKFTLSVRQRGAAPVRVTKVTATDARGRAVSVETISGKVNIGS